jgi:hypothetical protein
MNTTSLAISGISIKQDSHGRFCLNDLHKAAGGEKKHRPNYWLELQGTKDLIKCLDSENPIADITAIFTKQGIGTFAVKELVYSYAMWISARFQITVIRAYDALVNQKPYGLKELPVEFISYAQCQEIRRIVKGLTGGDNSKYPSIYWSLHNRYSVNHYDKIPASQFDDAIMFLTGKPPVKMVLISETELEQLRHDKQFDYVRFIDLVNKSNEAGYVMVNKHTLRAAFHFLESSIKQYI